MSLAKASHPMIQPPVVLMKIASSAHFSGVTAIAGW
jgi:hypothetical protein